MTEVHDRVCRELAQCQKNYDFLRAAHSRLGLLHGQQRTILEARDAEIERLRGMFALLEWSHDREYTPNQCPVCRGCKPNHMPACALAAALNQPDAQAPQPDRRIGGWAACKKCGEMVKNGTEHVCKGEFRGTESLCKCGPNTMNGACPIHGGGRL